MNELSGVQVFVALLILIAGPGGAAWAGTRVAMNGLKESVQDIRRWLKGLEERTRDTERELHAVRAVLNDRDRRKDKDAD